jgi:hypothetical protein
MTKDQINIIREALTGGHTGDLSAEGQRKYLAALDIIERAQAQMGLLLEARNALAQTFPFDTGGIAALMTRIDVALGVASPSVTEQEVTRALERHCLRTDSAEARKDMRKALEGFVSDRTSGVKPSVSLDLHNRIVQRLEWLIHDQPISVQEFAADVRELLSIAGVQEVPRG